jgi:DNA-binding cell septation regulator SpoVG
MQLSDIRINLCGPAPAQSHPRIAQSVSTPQLADGDHGKNDCARGGRLRAFCSLTFDNTFVVRDVKLIEGNDGLFLAMPSRKLCDRCRRCSEKNHLRARFCNQCGTRLDENRQMPRPGGTHSGGTHSGATNSGAMNSGAMNGNVRGMIRPKLHADIAHPINAACRLELERRVLMAYLDELERSKLPGYIAPNLDGDYSDYDEIDHIEPHPAPATVHLRRTGTE